MTYLPCRTSNFLGSKVYTIREKKILLSRTKLSMRYLMNTLGLFNEPKGRCPQFHSL